MNRTILTWMAVCAAALAAPLSSAWAEGAGVRDGAKLFSGEAVAAAERTLHEIETEAPGNWQIRVETVASLDGKSPREAAAALAEKYGVKGIVVLIDKADHRVEIAPSKSAEGVFPKTEDARIVTALTKAFKAKDYDRGLRAAVAEIKFATLGIGVRDGAGMFSPEALAKADAALDALRQKTHLGAAVETFESLKGQKPAEAAAAGARKLQVHGLYVLISKNDHQVFTESSLATKSTFTHDRTKAVDDALTAAFKAGNFDRGLTDAVAVIQKAADAAPATAVASAPPPKPAAPIAPRLPDTPARPTPPAAMPVPAPRPAESGSVWPILLVVGGVLLFGLWILKKLFGVVFGSRQQPAYGPGYAAAGQAPPPGGYASRPGYAPQPQGPPPGYGYGPQAPPPGYGPQAPPPGRGGGMLGGLLGGLGGAVAGNILYDQMTHHHEGQGAGSGTGHVSGGGGGGGAPVPPTGGGDWGNAAPTAPPPETYDPNAGVGGSWDTPDQPAPDEPANTGGSWAAPEEPADTGGSWAAPDEPADTGGDWGGGGGDSGGANTDDQGGSW